MELFALFVFGLPLAYITLQVRALNRWDGTFRMAASLPVLAWTLWGLVFAIDVTRESDLAQPLPVRDPYGRDPRVRLPLRPRDLPANHVLSDSFRPQPIQSPMITPIAKNSQCSAVRVLR
jgi:hypothetical protein